MLSGIKKRTAVPEEEPSKARPSLNEAQLKRDLLMEDEQQIEEPPFESDPARQALRPYQECYQLFLSGQSQLLSQKLAALQSLKEERRSEPIKEENRFAYNLSFEADKDHKSQLKRRNRPIMASNRVSDYCIFCPDNEELELLSASNYVYLALSKLKTFKSYFHLILAPVDHQQTMIGLNEDIITEINNYKKCLIQAFDKIGLQVVFFEQFSKENTHIYIECLAMNYNRAQDLPFFFKQGLEDVEGNWGTHKSIIKIEKEKGGLQKQIPKAIKYLYIEFTLGYGYAHVIENQRQWKRQFCYQILATALGIETHNVKTTQEYSAEQLSVRRQNFSKIWKQFDWTQLI